MRSFIDVTLHVTISLEESLELETALAGATSPAASALREALRIQNSTASRLTGALALAGAVRSA